MEESNTNVIPVFLLEHLDSIMPQLRDGSFHFDLTLCIFMGSDANVSLVAFRLLIPTFIFRTSGPRCSSSEFRIPSTQAFMFIVAFRLQKHVTKDRKQDSLRTDLHLMSSLGHARNVMHRPATRPAG
jgi:hypothetical protein